MALFDINSLATVLHTASTSLDPKKRKSAEKILERIEMNPGAMSTLADIFGSAAFDDNIRIVAAIVFKNAISRFWPRRFETEPFQKQEKKSLKERLPDICLDEGNDRLFEIMNVIVSKIARIDWPQNWSSLLPYLLSSCDNTENESFSLRNNRALLLLLSVLTELASKRLAQSRANLQVGAHSMLAHVCELWHYNIALVVKQRIHNYQNAIRATRILGLLIVSADIQQAPEAKPLFEAMHSAIQVFVGDAKYHELLLELFTIIHDVVRKQTVAFRIYLLPFLNIFVEVLNTSLYQNQKEQSLAAFALSTLANVCQSLHRPSTCAGLTFSALRGIKFAPHEGQQATEIVSEFFTLEKLQNMVSLLVHSYVRISSKDLQQWKMNPDTFFLDELYSTDKRYCNIVDMREEESRHAALRCLCMLSRLFGDRVFTIVISLLKVSNDITDELHLDAIYACVGGSLPDILDQATAFSSTNIDTIQSQFTFVSWWTTTLHNFVHSSSSILRRRLFILITQFTRSKLLIELVKPIKQLLVTAATNSLADNDIVVALESSRCLQQFMELFSLNSVDIALKHIISASLNLAFKTHELHALTFTLTTIKTALSIGRQSGTNEVIDPIVQAIPQLWQHCETMNVARGALVDVLTSLIYSVSFHTVSASLKNLRSVVEHILKLVIQPHTLNENAYIETQSCLLWLAWLTKSKSFVTPAGTLFSFWTAVATRDSDSAHTICCLDILNGYILVGSHAFCETYLQSITTYLSSLLSSCSEKVALCAIKAIQSLCSLYSNKCLSMIPDFLVQLLHEALVVPVKRSDEVIARICCVFARLLFVEFDITMMFLHDVSQHTNTNTLMTLLNAWLLKFDSISCLSLRHVSLLAFGRLIASAHPIVMQRISSILAICSSVLVELEQEEIPDAILGGHSTSARATLLHNVEQCKERFVPSTAGASDLEELLSTSCDSLLLQHIFSHQSQTSSK